MGIFIHLMVEVEFWLMQTLRDNKKEGTHTLMTMKPGLLAREVNTVWCQIQLNITITIKILYTGRW